MPHYDTDRIKDVIERYAPDGGQGQPSQEAGLWIENGFEDPDEVRAWLEAGVVDPSEARARVEQGEPAGETGAHGRDVVLGTTESRIEPTPGAARDDLE